MTVAFLLFQLLEQDTLRGSSATAEPARGRVNRVVCVRVEVCVCVTRRHAPLVVVGLALAPVGHVSKLASIRAHG